MFKVFLTIRNRLEMTKKTIESLYNHSHYKFQLHVYNNLSDYKIEEHFAYLCGLYKEGLISQITFNTNDSCFNAFSKAVANNQFGYNHQQDPQKDKYLFLLFLDNDIILTKDWDKTIYNAWKDVDKYKMNNIKIIGQFPGGIKYSEKCKQKIANCNARIGKLGGSGFWTVRPNFFNDIGFLPINRFIGINKKHDQIYWNIIDKKNKGKSYILGLEKLLCIHAGSYSGSVCNTLTKNKNKNNIDITFKKQEESLSKKSFEDFYNEIYNNKKMKNDW